MNFIWNQNKDILCFCSNDIFYTLTFNYNFNSNHAYNNSNNLNLPLKNELLLYDINNKNQYISHHKISYNEIMKNIFSNIQVNNVINSSTEVFVDFGDIGKTYVLFKLVDDKLSDKHNEISNENRQDANKLFISYCTMESKFENLINVLDSLTKCEDNKLNLIDENIEENVEFCRELIIDRAIKS